MLEILVTCVFCIITNEHGRTSLGEIHKNPKSSLACCIPLSQGPFSHQAHPRWQLRIHTKHEVGDRQAACPGLTRSQVSQGVPGLNSFKVPSWTS